MNTDNFPDVFNDPEAGAALATLELKAMKTLLDQINASAGNVTKTLSAGFGAATASGKSFNDTLATIAQSLAKIALREGTKSLAQGLVSGLSGIFSGAFGGGGAIAPFAEGGVIASPAYFANGGTIGLLGERGAEAIMPLARGPDGRLGVIAQSGAARAVSITVNIAAQDVESFRRSEGQITSALGLIRKRAMIGDTIDVLKAGPVGRFDKGSSVTVVFGGGQLASVDDLSALAGRTAMAIQGADGAWEIFSFARAELVGERTYRLSSLIRGLGGESHLAARDAPAGATVVLLDDALVPLARGASEIGAPIAYAIGPADRDYADPLYVRATVTATNKALRPYAPTQARAKRTASGIVISFIRRSRIDSDAWETIDVPLGEANEAYEAEIALPSGTRMLTATTASILYPAAQEIADFGAPQSALSLSLFQISTTVGRGFPLAVTLPIQ